MFKRKTMMRLLMVLAILVISSCSGSDQDKNSKKSSAGSTAKAVVQEEFHGWESLTLMNSIIRLDIVPELGGKIMGYSMHGYQALWHDTQNEGLVDNDQGYGYGGHFVNPGGAKVWPAPQGWDGEGQWPGPPDDVLDSAVYDVEYEGDAIVVTSPDDDGPGRSGLRLKHKYSLVKSSSLLNLELSMTNVVDHPVTWSLWHLATLPVDRDITVTVPAKDDSWQVMFGDKENSQWKGASDGFFTANYEKQIGKVGINASKGWAAWRDGVSGMTFVMMFPLDKKAEYPDNGSNVEIWTNGGGSYTANGQNFDAEYDAETASVELEILGPLTKLAPGTSATLDVQWGMARCSGIKDVSPGAIIVEEFKFDEKGIHAKFASFFSGDLYQTYLTKEGKQASYSRVMGVTPFSEVTLMQSYDDIITWRAETVRFDIKGADGNMYNVGTVTLR